MDFNGGSDIRFARVGRAGVVTLSRPDALNALSHRMVRALTDALLAWAADDEIKLVVIENEGRAFSSGVDLREVYEEAKAGRPPLNYFADEYRLIALIARYPKPYVALVNGLAMGGGAGIAFHGSHRVMTENATFAMPEVGMGFFPDNGGTRILAGLKGSFGMYLTLTGRSAGWGDSTYTKLATHAVPASEIELLRTELLETADPEAALHFYAVIPPRETNDASIHAIATHFSRDTLEHVLASLRQAASWRNDFATRTLGLIESRSPTSVAVTFAQIMAGPMMSVEEALRMEYRILHRMLEGHDFFEGIRAAIIDKDHRPQWQPARIADLDPLSVEAHFASIGDDELVLWDAKGKAPA